MSQASDTLRWRHAKEIFTGALEMPASERAGWIRAQLAGDAELAAEVEGLLALHGESGLALDAPPAVAVAALMESGGGGAGHPRREGEVIASRYRVVKWLGGGGMGDVHETVDLRTGESVAIKSIRPHTGNSAQGETRFRREIRMAQRIDHPNVCRVYGLEEHDGELFCAMELLRGETLAKRIEGGPLSAEQALPVVRDLCAGLAAAHAAGVVHRDLKPANVVLSEGRAVIIDFGLAAASELEPGLTASGDVIGTLACMAPEQLTDGASTSASDIYSLGVLIHEMLTGRKPYGARSPLRLVAQKTRGSGQAARSAMAGLPRVWQEAIERCLQTDPAKRFGSANEVWRALERGRPSARFMLWRRAVMAPALGGLALACAWAGWLWMRTDYVPRAEAGVLFEQAREAMANAAPRRATLLLEQAAAADNRFVEARALLAAGYAGLDQPEKARDAALDAASASDRRWALGRGEQLALRAARAAVVRNYQEAATQYRLWADMETGARRTFALVSAGQALDLAGERDAALRTMEDAVQRDPVSAGPRIRLGLLLNRAGKPDRASAEFETAKAALERSGNLEGLADLLLARSGARLGGNEQDRQDVERVLALSAKTGNRYHAVTAKFRMAGVAVLKRDYDGAVRIARETAEEARREGMPVVAAQALSELGYSFLYLKRPEMAVPILREAVEMAERARATGILASSQLRLGEALGFLRQFDASIAVMEPAVRWMRQSGNQGDFPLVLIKWGTMLGATSRYREAEAVFGEAQERATRDGNTMYQAMALQRFGLLFAERDPVRAAAYFEQALAINAGLNGAAFQAASAWTTAGRFERAEKLITVGGAAKAGQAAGVDRNNVESTVLMRRAMIAAGRGPCAEAEPLAREAAKLSSYREPEFHALRACSQDPKAVRESLAWLQNALAKSDRSAASFRARNYAAVGTMWLTLKDWRAARTAAEAGLEESRRVGARLWEIENALVLRAAERALGNRAEAERQEPRILEIGRGFGFDPPEKFGGRQDLVRLWKAGGGAAGR